MITQLEGLARRVHALPERIRREEHRAQVGLEGVEEFERSSSPCRRIAIPSSAILGLAAS